MAKPKRKKPTKAKSTKKASLKKAKPKKAVLKTGSEIRLPAVRASLDTNEIKNVENELRDLMNWVAVFEQEYDLPREVVDKLLNKIHSIAKKIGWLRCKV
ncbi:hypothetical protein HYV79_01310 [Candidatus Woesearchaeota archaeon]|nr:hypothetical protein [Candidatus Woesearchaeota archaeon]